MSDPRTFGLQEIVTCEIVEDPSKIRLVLDSLRRDLMGSLERQGYQPVAEINVSAHAETVMSNRPLPQSWLDWLLRRPPRFPEPLFVLRLSVLAVEKETADAG